MPRDLADELITIRRAMPSDVGRAVRFGAEPTEGMVLVVPEDPAWQLAVRPTPTGWAVTEVHVLSAQPIGSLAAAPATAAAGPQRGLRDPLDAAVTPPRP